MAESQVTLTSNDPLYRQKVDSIKSILTNLTSHEAFFSVDEYGPFSIKVQTGRRLVAPNEVLTVPQWQRNKGTLIITAALELATNQVSHFYSPRKNTNEMIVMIERLRRTYADKDILFISWDCASWHMSRTLEEKVEFLNGWAEHDRAPRLELVPLPSRAQFLNIIESIFSGMARAVIHNSDFKDVDAAKEMIDKYFAQRNAYYTRNPQRAGATIWGKERCVAVFNESENYEDPQYR